MPQNSQENSQAYSRRRSGSYRSQDSGDRHSHNHTPLPDNFPYQAQAVQRALKPLGWALWVGMLLVLAGSGGLLLQRPTKGGTPAAELLDLNCGGFDLRN